MPGFPVAGHGLVCGSADGRATRRSGCETESVERACPPPCARAVARTVARSVAQQKFLPGNQRERNVVAGAVARSVARVRPVDLPGEVRLICGYPDASPQPHPLSGLLGIVGLGAQRATKGAPGAAAPSAGDRPRCVVPPALDTEGPRPPSCDVGVVDGRWRSEGGDEIGGRVAHGAVHLAVQRGRAGLGRRRRRPRKAVRRVVGWDIRRRSRTWAAWHAAATMA